MTPPSETMDVLTLSPLVGNCELLRDLLTADSMTMVRIVYTPINPVLPPPLESRPNFTEFWLSHRAWNRAHTKAGTWDDMRLRESQARYMFAQCSLETVSQMLQPIGYELLHVEHFIAVFAHATVAQVLHAHRTGHTPHVRQGPFDAWRQGWYCAPLSRYVMDLEVFAAFDTAWLSPFGNTTPSLARFHAAYTQFTTSEPGSEEAKGGREEEVPPPPPSSGALKAGVEERRREVWATESAHLSLNVTSTLPAAGGASGAGQAICSFGPPRACVCVVPYRGVGCDLEDASGAERARPYRAALVYTVGTDAGEGGDGRAPPELAEALGNLWTHFNALHEYPVLVFHAGLSDEVRKQAALAAPNRIWFFAASDSPARADDAGAASSGRALLHFRSGPLFQHAAVASFDFLWVLDADSRFTAAVSEDPLLRMHADPSVQFVYQQLARVPARSRTNRRLLDLTQLYFLSRGMEWMDFVAACSDAGARAGDGAGGSSLLPLFKDPEEPKVYAGQQPQWTGRIISPGCTALRLGSLARAPDFVDYMAFMEAHVERHTAASHDPAVVQTFALAIAAWFARGGGRAVELGLPYAGPGARGCRPGVEEPWHHCA